MFKCKIYHIKSIMKILKRNQIIIFVIALMLVSAGYLNYTANNQANTQVSTKIENSVDYAAIGDAKLVSSNGIVEANEQTSNNEIAENTNEQKNEISGIVEKESTSNSQTVNTSTTAKEDEYFSESRLTRDTMYSQMIESYQKILESSTISSDQKTIAQTEIKNINDTKNKIMICENLIKTKEISDLIIFVNDSSISVVVKSANLETDKIAQIQNIIAREMEAKIEDIHISNR